MEERRRSPRVETALAIHYQAVGSSARGTIPQTKTNIGAGGMRVPLAQQLEPGTCLKLELILPGTPTPIHVQGEIVWTGRSGTEGPYETGLRFTQVDQPTQERLTHFLQPIVVT